MRPRIVNVTYSAEFLDGRAVCAVQYVGVTNKRAKHLFNTTLRPLLHRARLLGIVRYQ